MGTYDEPQQRLLQDIAAGKRSVGNRATLGPMVPIRLFQALRVVGMGTALEGMVGGGARTIVYQSGQQLGQILGDAVLPSAKGDLDAYLGLIHKLCQDLRIGVVGVDKMDLSNGELTLRVDECVSCAGLVASHPICHFEAGMVGGIVRAFVKGPVKAVETRCHAVGDDTCGVDVQIL